MVVQSVQSSDGAEEADATLALALSAYVALKDPDLVKNDLMPCMSRLMRVISFESMFVISAAQVFNTGSPNVRMS